MLRSRVFVPRRPFVNLQTRYNSPQYSDDPRNAINRSGGLPDFTEHWNRNTFAGVGAGLTVISAAVCFHAPWVGVPMAGLTGYYWYRGIADMNQESSALRRNFPFLANVRFVLESVRPEIRQYFIESDSEGHPFARQARSLVYQRSKGSDDTVPFGTQRNTYEPGYRFASHSLWPEVVPEENRRVRIGGSECKQPYDANIFNISAMSYGALSENAILALNQAAKRGGFYHNTGEGGMSRFHLQPGGDIVWNVGTGYFGCGTGSTKRMFDPVMFKENAAKPSCKMIELKLSQGAKPAHGGMLPAAKITPAIAEARGLAYPATEDCNSPPRHSAFDSPHKMCEFIAQLRELSGGKPVGIKLCIGHPEDFSSLVHAFMETGIHPDFITIDGGEGGTGAAPSEFSNSLGMPMKEGLALAQAMLVGADLRKHIRLIAAGKIVSGFAVVETMAYGADICNSARGMMFALGCIQALKCNTNKCPTGITTQDKDLMAGLVIPNKAERVYNYQHKTAESAFEIMGAMGLTCPSQVRPHHIMLRTTRTQIRTIGECYPQLEIEPGSLLTKTSGLEKLQIAFDLDDDLVGHSV